MYSNNRIGRFVIAILLQCISVASTSCKKLVEVDAPVTSTSQSTVYNNDATATAVLTGIYTKMSASNIIDGGITSLSLFPSLSADELTLSDHSRTNFLAYYTNALTSMNTGGA